MRPLVASPAGFWLVTKKRVFGFGALRVGVLNAIGAKRKRHTIAALACVLCQKRVRVGSSASAVQLPKGGVRFSSSMRVRKTTVTLCKALSGSRWLCPVRSVPQALGGGAIFVLIAVAQSVSTGLCCAVWQRFLF